MYIDNNDFSAYDCILFRTALSDPKLFDILNKFKVLSNNKLIKLSEILYSYYKKNKSLPDFEYFKDLIPDKPGYEDITKTIEINDATLQAFHDTVHKLSFQSAVINIAENALNADKDYTTENLIKDVRNATYEYQDKVDDRFELSTYKSILDAEKMLPTTDSSDLVMMDLDDIWSNQGNEAIIRTMPNIGINQVLLILERIIAMMGALKIKKGS